MSTPQPSLTGFVSRAPDIPEKKDVASSPTANFLRVLKKTGVCVCKFFPDVK